MKPNIIFIHIMKCGGTSLRHMLLEEYGYDAIAPVPMGRSMVMPDYPYNHEMPLQYQRVITPEMVAGYDVVMSHYDWRIVERLPGWSVITVLRDPVRQIMSLYKFMKESPDFPAFDAPDFMGWVTSADASPYLNGQVQVLSGHGVFDLDVALRNLEDERLCFGILERFGESVARWNERFGWSMVVEHRNKTRGRVELSPAEYERVLALQYQDVVLYNSACEMFSAYN